MGKDFNDFISSIDPDDYRTIMIAANNAMKAANRFDDDSRIFFVSMKLLEYYHNWINQ